MGDRRNGPDIELLFGDLGAPGRRGEPREPGDRGADDLLPIPARGTERGNPSSARDCRAHVRRPLR